MARASTASEGHNWWLKLFARALILMEVHNWWGKAIPLTNKTIPYWHNFYLYEIWRPIVHAVPSTSDCRENTTPIPNKYNFIFVTNTNLHSNKYYIINEQWVQLLKGHGRMRIVECFSLWSECELGVVGTPEATPATLLRIVHFLGWLTWVDSSKASSWAKSRSEVLLDWDSEGLPSSGTSILLGGSLLNERE